MSAKPIDMPPVSWSPVTSTSVSGSRAWNASATLTAASSASTSRRFVAASLEWPAQSMRPPSTIRKKPFSFSRTSIALAVISARVGWSRSLVASIAVSSGPFVNFVRILPQPGRSARNSARVETLR